jgi:hypothetical protein
MDPGNHGPHRKRDDQNEEKTLIRKRDRLLTVHTIANLRGATDYTHEGAVCNSRGQIRQMAVSSPALRLQNLQGPALTRRFVDFFAASGLTLSEVRHSRAQRRTSFHCFSSLHWATLKRSRGANLVPP